MPDARVEIVVRQHEVEQADAPTGGPLLVGERWLRHTTSGVDEVEFLLTANTGSPPA